MAPSIGLLGCGRWGRNILRDLVALGARVTVAVPSAASRERAGALGAVAAVPDLAALPPQEGYVVAVPTVGHAAAIEALLPLGRPIFVEKPLTADLASARRIAVAGAGRVFVMDKWRYHPGVAALKELLLQGRIGDAVSLRAYRLGWGNPHRDVDAATILLPHDLSVALHLFGHLPPLVAARRTAPGDGGLVAWLGGDAGPSAVLEYSILVPEQRRSYVLSGSRGTAQLIDSYETELRFRPGPPGGAGTEERIACEGRLPLEAELAAFLTHLAGGPPPMSDVAEGLAVVERLVEIRAAAGLA